MIDVVFRVFDVDSDNHISFEEFIKGMSVFLKGKLEERMKCRLFQHGDIFTDVMMDPSSLLQSVRFEW